MGSRYTWDEAKRRSNLAKHGLDFANADMVHRRYVQGSVYGNWTQTVAQNARKVA